MIARGRKGIILAILSILFLGSIAHALAEEPPQNLKANLESIIHGAYDITFSPRGWGSMYNLPQSQFSLDVNNDFYDNSARFGEVGLFVHAMQNFQNPQWGELEIGDANLPNLISQTAENTLPWIWTPAGENFGTHDGETLPNEGLTIVTQKITGIFGTNAVCVDTSAGFNQYGAPKDTINKQTTSQLTSLAGVGQIFLAASYTTPAKKEEYLGIAKHVGDNLLTFIVTPEEESFGIHPEQLKDARGKSIPTGMMPFEFLVKKDSPDTPLCSDGGTIKINENRKGQMAQAALFLSQLGKETKEEKYARAGKIITEGILSMQECDGSYMDYTRWEGPGTLANVCRPTDGSADYDAYPGNVVTTQTKGFITDTSLILYFLSKEQPDLYQTNSNYKRAAQYLLMLEELDLGSGIARNGDPVKYASYAIGVTQRPLAQIMMANVFLRASCQESDVEIEKRFQKMAYALIRKSLILIPGDLDAKIADAISPDVGWNMLAASAAADSWKIVTKGCQDCIDSDEDGHIDGVCSGDTVRYDCNDSDANIHPGAAEVCDGIDNDCDGVIDNGFDADNDAYTTCGSPTKAVDCDDNSDEVYPNAPEIIDGADNDCDGKADNTGIQVTVQNDLNVGVPNVEIIFIDYGNACANSFATLTSSISQIKEQCTTTGNCTTDENGMCLAALKKDGKFQGLANIPGNGMASNPVEFQVGHKAEIVFSVKGTLGTGTDTDNGENQPVQNPFTSNALVFGATIVVLLALLGIGGYFFLKSGKLKAFSKNIGGKKTLTADKPMDRRPPNTGAARESITILSSPRKTKEGFKIKLPKFPSFSARKIASKIVESKPLGKMQEHKILKPGNFPKKPIGGMKTSGPRKIWKDE